MKLLIFRPTNSIFLFYRQFFYSTTRFSLLLCLCTGKNWIFRNNSSLFYSARTIEFQYLTGTPPYIAEMIGAIELLILPCQCVFFFIMTRIWNGVNADTFLPKGRRERLVIFGILGVLSILTIASLAYAQIMGFI
jgi:hypothetical protein